VNRKFMRYNFQMTDKKEKAKEQTLQGFVLGWRNFEKISAVEGLVLSGEMKNLFEEFERENLHPEERRKVIAQRYEKAP